SPLIANGLPAASLTRSLIQGLALFQSKVSSRTRQSANSPSNASMLHHIIFRIRMGAPGSMRMKIGLLPQTRVQPGCVRNPAHGTYERTTPKTKASLGEAFMQIGRISAVNAVS